jgi:curved DNA-binding protein CbpA
VGDVTIYEMLGVSPAVTDGELRRVYRARVHVLHPDRNGDPEASAELGVLNVEWRSVNQPGRRAAYDLRIESDRRTAERLENTRQDRAAREALDRRRREGQEALESRRRQERDAIEAAMAATRARGVPPPGPERKPLIDKKTVRLSLDVAIDVLDAFLRGGQK